jgi:uncharacterized protein (DUF1778 family)
MSVSTKTNGSRLNFRLPAEIKRRIENAALISGVTVTDFAVSALASSADEVLRHHHDRKLSDRDRGMFLTMLENPPEPNATLRKAASRYKKLVKK